MSVNGETSRLNNMDKLELLTDRELEVLHLLIKGLSNKEISLQMSISYNTVKNHLTNIYNKLNVSDRIQATLVALNIQKEENVSRETF